MMLVEFRVKNFRSLRDEQVLSLVAAKDNTLQDTNTQAPFHRDEVMHRLKKHMPGYSKGADKTFSNDVRTSRHCHTACRTSGRVL